jgi:CspA family cold shock protein
MIRGVIKIWNADRGYGFIRRDDGGTDVFGHVRHLSGAFRPESGTAVIFDIVLDERSGRERADSIRLA